MATIMHGMVNAVNPDGTARIIRQDRLAVT